MASNIVKFIFLYIILVLLQVLVLDNISFMGYATPFLYIYFMLKLPIGINQYLITLLGFFLGLTIDLFCNTPGINAAATTSIAFFRRPIQGLFFQKNDFETMTPSMSLLGSDFIKYAILCIFIHHTILFSIETFSYFNVLILLTKILTSTIITSILIIGIDSISLNNKKRDY